MYLSKAKMKERKEREERFRKETERIARQRALFEEWQSERRLRRKEQMSGLFQTTALCISLRPWTGSSLRELAFWWAMNDHARRHAYVRYRIDVYLPIQIMEMRLGRGWTQKELAARAGVKQSVISRYESIGYGSHMTLATLDRIAKAFDVAYLVRFPGWKEFYDLIRSTFNPPKSFTEVFAA